MRHTRLAFFLGSEEDALQFLYMIVLENEHVLEGASDSFRWSLLRNKAVSHIRPRRKERSGSGKYLNLYRVAEDWSDQTTHEEPEEPISQEKAVIARDLVNKIMDDCNRILPPHEAVVLEDLFSGRPVHETAKELGLTPGRISQIRTELTQKMRRKFRRDM